MTKNISIDLQGIAKFVSCKKIQTYKEKTTHHFSKIISKDKSIKKYLGWVDYPNNISDDFLKSIEDTATYFRKQLSVIVIVGVGGSYLGAKMVNEALKRNFPQTNVLNEPLIVYAGYTLSEDYLFELTKFLEDKSFGLCVISKSGSTLESALTFRILKKLLEKKVGKKNTNKYIIAITDKKKGLLKIIAEKNKYQTFVIPDDIGGRFSVLTPVGLVPIALAGNNIRQIIKGATTICSEISTQNFENNIACQYATLRNILYAQEKLIEILITYEPNLHYLAEWWKQLFAESEGKQNKGIFTASSIFTTDLHSLGQYIQDGKKILFETSIIIEQSKNSLKIPVLDLNLDKLNYLNGKTLDYVNKTAARAVQKAHIDGDVPNLLITIPQKNEFYIGQLIYFFQLSCAISGYLLGINPFNQPGVEEYKNNMFRLLKKDKIGRAHV